MDTDALFNAASLKIQQNNEQNSEIKDFSNNLSQLEQIRSDTIKNSLEYIAKINKLNNDYYTKIANALKLPTTDSIIKILSSCSTEDYTKIALLETIKEAKIACSYLFKNDTSKILLQKELQSFSNRFLEFFKDKDSPTVQSIQEAQKLWELVKRKRPPNSNDIVQLRTVLSRISHIEIGRLYEDLLDYVPKIDTAKEVKNIFAAVEKKSIYAIQNKAEEVTEEINNRRYSTRQTEETGERLQTKDSKADRILSLLIDGVEYQIALSLKSGKFVEYNSNEPQFYNRFSASFEHTGLNIESLTDRSFFINISDFTPYIEPIFNSWQPSQLYKAMLIILDIIALNKVIIDIGGTLKLPVQYITFFNEWYRVEDVYNELLAYTKDLQRLGSILGWKKPTEQKVEEQMNNDGKNKFETFAKKIKFSASIALILRQQGIKVNNTNILKERKDVV